MKPAAFAYHRATDLAQAIALLDRLGDDARVLAGGQSLVPMMNMRIARPAHLVDVNDVAELDFIRLEGKQVRIGALTRHHAIERSVELIAACPILPAAARHIGHYAIRQRGTVGGSLALADPAAQWPLLAVLLEAEIEVAGSAGQRAIAAADFFQDVFTTTLQPGEIVTSIAFPRLAAGEGWDFRLFTRRAGDFAIVAVAATLTRAVGRVQRLRLAVSGTGPKPEALTKLAAAQTGAVANSAWADSVARAAAASVDPVGNHHASAEFRRELVAELTGQALGDTLARAA